MCDMCRSVNLPRPKNETLSRHSFLGQTGLKGQWQGPTAEMKVNLCSRFDLTQLTWKLYVYFHVKLFNIHEVEDFLLDAGSISEVH